MKQTNVSSTNLWGPVAKKNGCMPPSLVGPTIHKQKTQNNQLIVTLHHKGTIFLCVDLRCLGLVSWCDIIFTF